MATATLTRGSTTVELTLLESGGSPVATVDHGKPTLVEHNTGALDPRTQDQFAGLTTYNLLGRFVTDTAYQDAIELADLIKSHSNGNDLLLNVDIPEFDTDIKVAPAVGQEQAVSMVYNPGRRDWVDVDIGLTRISELTAGSVGSDQLASTPTATGTGPVQLSYSGTTVDLTSDVTVERSVGRPQSDTQGQVPNNYPIYQDKQKTAHESFELSLEFVTDAVSKVTQLKDMFNTKLGRTSFTLDFNGLYGLGSFNVVPDGSGALRHIRVAGEQGVTQVPTINLRRVYQ